MRHIICLMRDSIRAVHIHDITFTQRLIIYRSCKPTGEGRQANKQRNGIRFEGVFENFTNVELYDRYLRPS